VLRVLYALSVLSVVFGQCLRGKKRQEVGKLKYTQGLSKFTTG